MIKYIKYNLTFLFISFMLLSNVSIIGQWLPDTRLTNDTAESIGSLSFQKWISVKGSNIHLVWSDKRNGNSAIYYKKSSNNGNSWSIDFKLNDNNAYASGPAIEANNNFIHIVWSDRRHGSNQLYYIRSTNNGNTWSANYRISSNDSGSGAASISCSGNNVNIAWTDIRNWDNGRNAEIYFINSTNNGATWNNEIRLTNAQSYSQYPSIGQYSSNIHIVWDDGRDGINKSIYYKRSTDGGLNWDSDYLLANTPLTVWGQTISVSGSNVHVSYMVQTTPSRFEVFYKNSQDGGLTWNPEINVSNTNFIGAVSPSIFSYGSVVHLVWLEENNNNKQIKYKRSTSNGLSWDSSEFITPNTVQADNPCIVASNSATYVVWNDSRDGNKEIYYKKNPTCNGPFTVSGLVTFKDNNQSVSGGFVKALKYETETAEIITVDSTVINSNGTYMLSHMPSEELDLMYYQDDDLLQFVPTYYVSTIDWREATKITPTGNLTNINCQVFRINNTANPFSISGLVTANLDNSSVSAMKDAIVYAKSSGSFRNYGISNGSGSYITTKLPAGSYELIAHRMGFAPVTQNVTITNSSLSNINFDMGSPLIGINIINENIPVKFMLSQNYPNPFNPATTIKFAVPVAGLIKLSVYDILGREIKILANENLAAGSYSVNWNASNYPSGIYFYRLEGSDFTETKKMILLK